MQRTITLPQTLVTPYLPTPAPLPRAPFISGPGYWNGKTPVIYKPADIDRLGNLHTVEMIGPLLAISTKTQTDIAAYYSAYRSTLQRTLNAELAALTHAATGDFLQLKNRELQAIHELISRKRKTLKDATRQSTIFFARPPLSRSTKQNAIDFVNRLQARRGPRASVLYQSYIDSLSAAYRVGLMHEAIASLEKKAVALSAVIASAEEEAGRIAAEQAIQRANTLSLGITSSPQLTGAGFTATTEVILEAAVRQAISLFKTGLEAVVSRVFAVGIGALVYSPSLGNGERSPAVALSLPANTLLPELPVNLREIAAAQGSIPLPYRILGNHDGYALVATSGGTGLSSNVPVRTLTLDPEGNNYISTTADSPPITLSFPISTPGNTSTNTPAVTAQPPVYPGVTLQPIEIEVYTLPATELQSIKDCIYCFPIETGLPPLYVVLSAPYPSDTIGAFSGRGYELKNAGGPIIELDWSEATVTTEGIVLVKLHTGRFAPSDANTIMIERLERILRGEIPITDTDKRFYTHEIRELSRYRAIGVPDGFRPDDQGITWNNAHTATLEDFQLSASFDLLYTPEALEAEHQQIEREFK